MAASIVADTSIDAPRRAEQERGILFEPIEPGDLDLRASQHAQDMARFASLVRDVTSGVDVVLSIAERDAVDSGCAYADGTPAPALLSNFHHGMLIRLCRASLSMLAHKAEDRLDAARASA